MVAVAPSRATNKTMTGRSSPSLVMPTGVHPLITGSWTLRAPVGLMSPRSVHGEELIMNNETCATEWCAAPAESEIAYWALPGVHVIESVCTACATRYTRADRNVHLVERGA